MTTKASIVSRVADSIGISKRAAANLVNLFAGILHSDLSDNGVANIPGVGKLKLTDRAARAGRNPRTGETLQIPARKAVRFRPSADLKRSVQQ